jgi:hypothetical protein
MAAAATASCSCASVTIFTARFATPAGTICLPVTLFEAAAASFPSVIKLRIIIPLIVHVQLIAEVDTLASPMLSIPAGLLL